MKPTKQRQGGPLVSMCYSAGTGSSVLDPPSVVVASLRAVDHRCCTPLPVKFPVMVEKVVKVEKVVVVNPWPRG